MVRLAEALAGLAAARGAEFRYGRSVARILTGGGRIVGVETDAGERIAADAVIWNGDVAALADGAAGPEARRAVGERTGDPSLSAVTWAMSARVGGFPLIRHNVFFSRDYRAEFDALARGRLPAEPTVYVCAQDRGDEDRGDEDRGDDDLAPSGPERIFCLVNAPARAAGRPLTAAEIDTCETAAFRMLERSGLEIERDRAATVRTSPEDFAAAYPASRGALYGPATHGWRATFAREGARTRLPGLYLAGGSVHPGPGAPMAALSGRQAALAAIRDLAPKGPAPRGPASTGRSPRGATPGGTSTR
jgi:1-hydroxycarotenoid 3,4-desaturase